MKFKLYRWSTRQYRQAALFTGAGIFSIGNIPSAGLYFPGLLHWMVHVAAFALLAMLAGFGWRRRPALWVAFLVAALGALHEAGEIYTHGHGFEVADAGANAAGAFVGIGIQRLWQSATRR